MKKSLTFESIKNAFHKYYVPTIVSAALWVGNGTLGLINTYHKQASQQRIEQLQAAQRSELANARQDAQLSAIAESLKEIRERLNRQPSK